MSKITDTFKHTKSTDNRSVKKSISAPAKKKLKTHGVSVESLGVSGEAAVTNLDIDEQERMLRAFDLTSKYGPSIGVSRLERWERAHKFDLDPPVAVKELLIKLSGKPTADRCLWEGRV